MRNPKEKYSIVVFTLCRCHFTTIVPKRIYIIGFTHTHKKLFQNEKEKRPLILYSRKRRLGYRERERESNLKFSFLFEFWFERNRWKRQRGDLTRELVKTPNGILGRLTRLQLSLHFS